MGDQDQAVQQVEKEFVSIIILLLINSSSILVPRGRAPFGQHQKSRPLARPNDIPVLNGFVNTID